VNGSRRIEAQDGYLFYAGRRHWRERLVGLDYERALSIVGAAVDRALPRFIVWARHGYPAGARVATEGLDALWAAVTGADVDLFGAYNAVGEHLLDDRDPRYLAMSAGADNAYGALLQGLRVALGTRERALDALMGSFWSVGQPVANALLRGRIVLLREQSELVLAQPRAFAELAFQERLFSEVEQGGLALTRARGVEISREIGEHVAPDPDVVAAFRAADAEGHRH
jgi:hypothetical protein